MEQLTKEDLFKLRDLTENMVDELRGYISDNTSYETFLYFCCLKDKLTSMIKEYKNTTTASKNKSYDNQYMFGKYVLVTKCEIDGWKDFFEMFDDYETALKEGQKYVENIKKYPANGEFAIFEIK
jgi:hypothetical protein